jgi:transposase
MSAQRNKTDATDALGLAHIVRTGWFRQAHTKTESCYRLRLLLTQRRNLKRKVLDLKNTMRHSLKVLRDPHQRHRAHRLRQSGVRGGGCRCADQ